MKKNNTFEECFSLWDSLVSEKRPIFMYGTGNGGDKIIAALDRYGVRLTGIFASDGFVRNRDFHGYHVRSYSDIIAEYGNDIVVLLAFGTTLDSVRSFISELGARHTLYIPDVPLYGGELFDMNYFTSHRTELEYTSALFADDISVNLFYDTVNFRLTGKTAYLCDTGNVVDTLKEIVGENKISCVIDGGAFRGDSAADYITALSPSEVLAVEADPKTYVKLCEYAKNENRAHVIPINAALSDAIGEIAFVSSGSRGSGAGGRNHRANDEIVKSSTIDEIAENKKIDFIELDVEGAEEQAIHGALKTIKRDTPCMSVSLYHKTDDLTSLTGLIHTLLPDHKLYLRRIPCIPMWDLTLYAIKA